MTEEPLFSYALDLRISSPTHTEGSLCLLLFRNFDLFDFSFPNSEYIASCAKNCKSNILIIVLMTKTCRILILYIWC